jgi:hypothetical protein
LLDVFSPLGSYGLLLMVGFRDAIGVLSSSVRLWMMGLLLSFGSLWAAGSDAGVLVHVGVLVDVDVLTRRSSIAPFGVLLLTAMCPAGAT